jgi:hypothetical protein
MTWRLSRKNFSMLVPTWISFKFNIGNGVLSRLPVCTATFPTVLNPTGQSKKNRYVASQAEGMWFDGSKFGAEQDNRDFLEREHLVVITRVYVSY